MSKVFFEEMEIPEPMYNLEVGSGTHGHMTGEIIRRTEEVLLREKPEMVIVYGDTNTTLGGAIAASKLHIPVAHIEAGLRSFNKSMPEEINRILTDHVSTLLFSPTETGIKNLLKEGFRKDSAPPFSADNPKIYHCGDVMYDNTIYFAGKAEKQSIILKDQGLENRDFVLCTIHRDSNTDQPERLGSILSALDLITYNYHLPVVLPLHPRTAKMIASLPDQGLVKKLQQNPLFILTAPVGYIDMLLLEKRSRIILTDSGGVQKESYFFQKPCIVLRPETEWKELVEQKTAILANSDNNQILAAFDHFYQGPPKHFPSLYGDGSASKFICSEIFNFLDQGH